MCYVPNLIVAHLRFALGGISVGAVTSFCPGVSTVTVLPWLLSCVSRLVVSEAKTSALIPTGVNSFGQSPCSWSFPEIKQKLVLF